MRLAATLFAALRDLLGDERLVTEFQDLITYECDGHTLETAVPLAVALPETTGEVSEVVQLLAASTAFPSSPAVPEPA